MTCSGKKKKQKKEGKKNKKKKALPSQAIIGSYRQQ